MTLIMTYSCMKKESIPPPPPLFCRIRDPDPGYKKWSESDPG
jgi:hypothetical protein